MRREIRNIFDNSSVEAEKFLNDMKVNIEMEVDNYIGFNVQTHTDIEYHTYKTGFLGLQRTLITEEKTTYTASVSEVISNMRSYVGRCKKYINEEFEKIINLSKLETSVKKTVTGAFDLSGKDFNENDILIPLEIAIKKIQIPKIDIDVTEFGSMIVDAFSGGTVEGNKIHELRLLENRVFENISKKISDELDKCEKKIESVMTEQSATFVDNIINQLTVNIEMLRNQIDDKENAIRQYNTLCEALAQYKQMVIEMEM